MSEMKHEIAETITAVSVHNGVARLFFAGMDIDGMTKLESPTEPPKTKPVLCTAMPLPGFLYAATVIEKFLREESVQAIIRNMDKAGVAPEALDLSVLIREDKAPEDGSSHEDKATESSSGKTAKSKKSEAELVDAAE